MSQSDLSPEVLDRARERLRGAGLPDDRIAVVLDRAAQLLACLDTVAALDSDLPEPALTWQPIEEAS